MKHINPTLLLALASGVASAGCSSSSDKSAAPVGPDNSQWTAAVMQPCKNALNTIYDNDDLCLEPPDPEIGFQVYFGPGMDKNYDDPAALAPYVLEPGSGDSVLCVAATTPNTDIAYSQEHHVRTRTGTHHIIYWRSIDPTTSNIPPDGTQAGECRFAGIGSGNQSFFFGTESGLTINGGVLDAPLRADDITKYTDEEKGYAFKIPAKTRLWIETHFINVGDKPILREAWANMAYKDAASVTQIMDPIFFIAGGNLNLPPGQQTTTKSGNVTRPPAFQGDVRFMAFAAHAHAHTTRETAYLTRAGGAEEIVYQTYNWQEPIWAQFDGAHNNPPIVPGQEAAVSGPFYFNTGDTLRWECDVNNTTPDEYSPNPVTLQWGDLAYTGEMCNLFGYYVPGNGTMWSGG